MTQPRPLFHPISAPADVSDEELAKFAKSQGVASLVKPAVQTPAVGPTNTSEASNEAPRSSPSAPAPKRASAPKKTAPAPKPLPDLKLSVRVPGYVSDELNLRAARERCTVRHLVLQGLQAMGIEIAEPDLNPDERRGIYRKHPR